MREGYRRRYLRAHPNSETGKSFTNAHDRGWVLVCFNHDGYPIFRESIFSWFKRIIKREPKGGME